MKIKKIIFALCVVSLLYPTQIGKSVCLPNTQHEEITVENKNILVYKSKIKIVSKDTKKLSQEDVDLISRVVMAEAEDEPYEGKIYVVDTILNRVDSKKFPNTVRDVIYQKDQFTSMWNGRYNRCQSNKDLDKMIQEEYNNRSNSDIVFFTADHYGEYGKRLFSVGNHYFASYK